MRSGVVLLMLLFSAGAALAQPAGTATAPRVDPLQTELIARVSPAVVGLTCRTERLFYYGTGVVISREGLVLTNLSVIPPSAKRIQVFFVDGTVHPATIVEYDVPTESILLQLVRKPADRTFPWVDLADSGKARVGDRVYTFGNPFNSIEHDAQVAVAAGALSAIGEVTDNAEEQSQSSYKGPMLETDAAVNPGSDGGPLTDAAGRLLGIMSLAYQRERMLGTCIPLHLIARRLKTLSTRTLHAPPVARVTASTAVLGHRARTLAPGVVWLTVERAPETPAKMPEQAEIQAKIARGEWTIFDVIRQRLRVMMNRPPGYATGISISGGKYVLTSAYHVTHQLYLEGKVPSDAPLLRKITVHAAGLDTPLEAKLVSRFEPYDLALLEVIGGPLPVSLELGSDEKLVEGTIVGALGRQRGVSSVTLTQGIVGAVGRNHNLVKVLQTSAAANYANLGGPVIDLNGQVVGLQTFLNTGASWGLNSGVGLFTGASTIRRLLPQMLAGTSQADPPLPFLGVGGWEAKSIGGAAIAMVHMQAGAFKAGVKPGDLIISVDGKPIGEWSDLIRTITGKRIGQKITFEVMRGDKRLELSSTLGRRPSR